MPRLQSLSSQQVRARLLLDQLSRKTLSRQGQNKIRKTEPRLGFNDEFATTGLWARHLIGRGDGYGLQCFLEFFSEDVMAMRALVGNHCLNCRRRRRSDRQPRWHARGK